MKTILLIIVAVAICGCKNITGSGHVCIGHGTNHICIGVTNTP